MPYFLRLNLSLPYLSYGGRLWLKKQLALLDRYDSPNRIRVNLERNLHFAWFLLTFVPNQDLDAVGDLKQLSIVCWLQSSLDYVSWSFLAKLNVLVLCGWHLQEVLKLHVGLAFGISSCFKNFALKVLITFLE